MEEGGALLVRLGTGGLTEYRVLLSTDEYHFSAWKKIMDEEGIPFDREVYPQLLGLGRLDSLEVILRHAAAARENEAVSLSAEEKNAIARDPCFLTPPFRLQVCFRSGFW